MSLTISSFRTYAEELFIHDDVASYFFIYCLSNSRRVLRFPQRSWKRATALATALSTYQRSLDRLCEKKGELHILNDTKPKIDKNLEVKL